MLFFGSNHQSLQSAKKVFGKTKILVVNEKSPAYLKIDLVELRTWVILMKEFYWDWDGWTTFNFLDKKPGAQAKGADKK